MQLIALGGASHPKLGWPTCQSHPANHEEQVGAERLATREDAIIRSSKMRGIMSSERRASLSVACEGEQRMTTAMRATDFIGTLGVNTHIDFTNYGHQNLSLVFGAHGNGSIFAHESGPSECA